MYTIIKIFQISSSVKFLVNSLLSIYSNRSVNEISCEVILIGKKLLNKVIIPIQHWP